MRGGKAQHDIQVEGVKREHARALEIGATEYAKKIEKANPDIFPQTQAVKAVA